LLWLLAFPVHPKSSISNAAWTMVLTEQRTDYATTTRQGPSRRRSSWPSTSMAQRTAAGAKVERPPLSEDERPSTLVGNAEGLAVPGLESRFLATHWWHGAGHLPEEPRHRLQWRGSSMCQAKPSRCSSRCQSMLPLSRSRQPLLSMWNLDQIRLNRAVRRLRCRR
jgi:hypothetical protein